MREIKFRAFDGRKMIEPYSVRNGEAFIIRPCDKNDQVITGPDGSNYYKDWDIDVATGFPLMQLTGLKDKNGLDIYEGDILGDLDGPECLVYFYAGCFCADPLRLGIPLMDISESLVVDMVVIGNIHEDPKMAELCSQ